MKFIKTSIATAIAVTIATLASAEEAQPESQVVALAEETTEAYGKPHSEHKSHHHHHHHHHHGHYHHHNKNGYGASEYGNSGGYEKKDAYHHKGYGSSDRKGYGSDYKGYGSSDRKGYGSSEYGNRGYDSHKKPERHYGRQHPRYRAANYDNYDPNYRANFNYRGQYRNHYPKKPHYPKKWVDDEGNTKEVVSFHTLFHRTRDLVEEVEDIYDTAEVLVDDVTEVLQEVLDFYQDDKAKEFIDSVCEGEVEGCAEKFVNSKKPVPPKPMPKLEPEPAL